MPPYQSAAEKRRQRAIETADAWSAPTMLDGFGQKEKTGVGSRNLANADSLPPRSEVAYSVASSSPRLLPAAPPQLPPLYYQHEPPVNGAGYGYPTPPPVHAYQLPQPSPRPYNVVSIARQPPMPPPPPAQAPVVPNPRQLLANNSNNLHNYAPMVQVSTAAVFDPNLFGNNTSPSKPPAYVNSGYSGAYPVGKPSTHIGMPYEPHPLEYDGATPPPVAHFAAPSTALEEYYNRTRGPVLSDDDRAAIEDFFATDDFTMQFNAQAAAKRSQQQQQQQQQHGVMKPPHRVGSLVTPRGPAGSDTSGADVKYPVCHKCHADILASANKANKKRQPGANPRAAAVKPGVRGGGGGGKVFRR